MDNLKRMLNRAPADVVGVDCAKGVIRLARLKKGTAGIELTAAGILPVPRGLFDQHQQAEEVHPLPLPANLCGRYASVTAPSSSLDIKLLRVDDDFDPENYVEMFSRMALDMTDKRLSSSVIIPATAKIEGRIIAAAMPESLAVSLLRLFPAAGAPAPRTVSWSELAVIHAFTCDPLLAGQEKPVGLIHFDHDFSLIALLNEGFLSQLRVFSFGVSSVLMAIMRALNVDRSTAEGVFMDGAFDISHLIQADFRDILGQLIVCRDFMERSENCVLERIYMSGPAALTSSFSSSGPLAGHVSEWNALEPYGKNVLGTTDIPDDLLNEPWRLAAAIGSGLGVLNAS